MDEHNSTHTLLSAQMKNLNVSLFFLFYVFILIMSLKDAVREVLPLFPPRLHRNAT